MPFSRRRLLGALGVGAATSVAGCSGINPLSGSGDAAPPDGQLDESMANAIYAPGRVVDVDHRRVTVRHVAGLREHEESEVATGLADHPTARIEQGFDQDPGTLDAYAFYGSTELFVGSFSRADVLESYRSDEWTVTETYEGVDVLEHTEYPERYASGVADGLFLTSRRFRERPPVEFVRAHAEALAGETGRYGDDEVMAELLSVVGGGDFVAAITVPVDVGYRLPSTLGAGRAIEVTDDGVVDTFAFGFDESAAESPQAYADRYGQRWREEVASEEASGVVTGATGRVGYFSTVRPATAFTGSGGVAAAISDGGPTGPMETSIEERYAREHGQEPPDATVTYRTVSDASDVACGEGSNAVAITYESGPAIPVRRVTVAVRDTGEGYSLRGCGFEYGERIEAGQTVRVGFRSEPTGNLALVWNGPHGNTEVLPVRRE